MKQIQKFIQLCAKLTIRHDLQFGLLLILCVKRTLIDSFHCKSMKSIMEYESVNPFCVTWKNSAHGKIDPTDSKLTN